MICYICGKLVFKSPAKVIIENNGIGYSFNVSIETSHSLGVEGEEAKLFTFLQIKDEEVSLYGFATEEEKEVFLLLISVPGIGPKMGLRILSGMSVSEFYNAIVSEETSLFTSVPGIGKKTGERLILELKHKVEKLPIPQEKQVIESREAFVSAVEALIVLGYRRKDAVSAVNKVMKNNVKAASIEDIIREALKRG